MQRPFNAFNIPFNTPSTPISTSQQIRNALQTKRPCKQQRPSKDNNNLDLDILKKDKHQ
jgi:hypothetical protein